MKDAVVLFGHGTVDDLDDLPSFVTNIRRGHPAPPELLAELRRRYEAIGGKSPFNTIAQELAQRVEERLGVPTVIAMRLFTPYAKDVLADLVAGGVERAAFVPLAQHSGAVYAEAAERAARELREGGASITAVAAPDWGQEPALLDAYAERVVAALQQIPPEKRDKTTTLFTAHSLPKAIIDAGDRYEIEFRASVDAVIERVNRALRSEGTADLRSMVAFQSQGPQIGAGGRPMAWLGPDLNASLDAIAARGDTHVLFAPIGFLADHVEVLYDLDIEADAMAKQRGLSYSRSRSLNADPALVSVVAEVAARLLGLATKERS